MQTSFAYKFVCIDNKFCKPVVLYRRKNALYKVINVILEEYCYSKKVIKKFFNKSLVMFVEDVKIFQSSNKCWICNKLFS